MRNDIAVCGGIGLGAVWMYFFDRNNGRRRRARVRDGVIHGVHQVQRDLGKALRDLENRSTGASARARSVVGHTLSPEAPVANAVLEARVRTALGRCVSHPHAIWTQIDDGRVVLKGDILDDEIHRLLSAVTSISGVTDVANRLNAHPRSEGIPGLQGAGRNHGAANSAWPPGLRLMAGVGGGALTACGVVSRGAPGVAAGVTGAWLLARAMANRSIRDVMSRNGQTAIDIQKTMSVLAPVDEVFSFLTHFPNLPRFMSHLQQVRDLGAGRYHWVADGPGGLPVSWDAEITRLIPNKLVAWRSLPGSRVAHEGQMRFEPTAVGGSRISVRLSYLPPGGVAGHWIAYAFRSDPKHEMDDDFARMKSLLELGKTRSRDGKPLIYESGSGETNPPKQA